MHDLVCFCCQQTAEKYLKALLEESSLMVPRTHDLEDLLDRLIPIHPALSPLRRGLKFLIQFAVHARYPGFSATKPGNSRSALGRPSADGGAVASGHCLTATKTQEVALRGRRIVVRGPNLEQSED